VQLSILKDLIKIMGKKLSKIQATLILKFTKKYLGNVWAIGLALVMLVFGIIVEVPSWTTDLIG